MKGAGLIKKEQARAASVEQIKALLSKGPLDVHAMVKMVSVARMTLYNHLDYMHKILRVAHPTGQKVGHSMIWQLGPDPALQSDEYREQLATQKRDPLVAALFGPATR